MFPANLRYSGMAISYNVSGAISGLLPLIATWLNSFHEEQSIVPAIIILIVISLATALGGFMGGRHQRSDDVQVRES